MKEKRVQVGIALGALFGLMHGLWVAIVGLGIGQPLVNALESWHFLSSTFSINEFDPVTAVAGILGAAITGYLIGWVFMYIYSLTGRKLDNRKTEGSQ